MEDRRKILEMLKEGKIDIDQAVKLLETINQGREKELKPRKKKLLRIQVLTDEGEKVNVRVPLSAAKLFSKFAPKEAGGVNIQEVFEHLEDFEEMEGDIVNVDAEDAKVRIWFE